MPNTESVSTGEQLLVPENKRRFPVSSLARQVAQFLAIALLALGSYLLISHFFLQSVTVVGVSMFPTLQDSDRYLLNRWVFYVRPPRRADVVVIRDPMDNGFSVKRVVAAAGDSVCVKEGRVFVNGREIQEPYLPPGTRTYPAANHAEQSFQCNPGQYFVLGDNRTFSVDSRVYGPVPAQNYLGLVIR